MLSLQELIYRLNGINIYLVFFRGLRQLVTGNKYYYFERIKNCNRKSGFTGKYSAHGNME